MYLLNSQNVTLFTFKLEIITLLDIVYDGSKDNEMILLNLSWLFVSFVLGTFCQKEPWAKRRNSSVPVLIENISLHLTGKVAYLLFFLIVLLCFGGFFFLNMLSIPIGNTTQISTFSLRCNPKYWSLTF